jgi:hypothetical protein
MEKSFCKRTVLLDVDLLVSTLNDDIIKYIKEFVGNKLIKDARILLIQNKYSLSSREKIEKMLYKWPLVSLLKFERNCVYLKYDVESFTELDIYEYTSDDFLLYYNELGICDTFINYAIYSRHQNKMKTINRILTNIRVRNYFHFQKNIWILTNKILGLV